MSGGFADPIVDDTTLVRPAIQSPDYVPGQSGWAVFADGTCEFNNASVRGRLQVGTPGQAGSVYIGPKDGDPILSVIPLADSGTIAYAAPNQAVTDTVGGGVDSYDVTRELWGSNVAGPPGFGLIGRAWRMSVDIPTMTAVCDFGHAFEQVTFNQRDTLFTNPVKVDMTGSGVEQPVLTGVPIVATPTFNASGIATVAHPLGVVPSAVSVSQNGNASGTIPIHLMYVNGSATANDVQIKAFNTSGAVQSGAVGCTVTVYP